jgi:D-3-phosphoglycerate dehydrogenase
MTNIVVLDDMELTLEQKYRLERLGNLKIYSGVPQTKEEILLKAKDAEILIVGWTKLERDILERLRNLKFIAVWATGYDYVDIKSAAQMNIPVSNIPGYAADSVAEMTIGLMISLSRKLILADEYVRSGGLSWKGFKGGELKSKTVGIVGMGNIGNRVAHIATGFGMQVISFTKRPDRKSVV